MEALTHLQTLRFFSQRADPFATLEALSFLKEGGYLGPLWLEFESDVCKKWQASEVNKGWAWGTDSNSTAVVTAWKFNKGVEPVTVCAKCDLLDQLEFAEDAFERIFASYNGPSEAMIKELQESLHLIKTDLMKKLKEFVL